MKVSLPIKLGIFVVLLFSVVIAGCLLYNPYMFWNYKKALDSHDESIREEAITSIVNEGERSIPYLADWIEHEKSKLIVLCSVMTLTRMLIKDITSLDGFEKVLKNSFTISLAKNDLWYGHFWEIIRVEVSNIGPWKNIPKSIREKQSQIWGKMAEFFPENMEGDE